MSKAECLALSALCRLSGHIRSNLSDFALECLDGWPVSSCLARGASRAFVWTSLRWRRGLCLDGDMGIVGFGGRKISATGYGGLSDNLSRPSRLSRLDRYKMRIRVDLSRHALYISVWTV